MWHAELFRTSRSVLPGLVALAVCLVLALAKAEPTMAHGGLSAEADTCVLRFAGTDFRMHFTGYQPNSQQQEFCEDIPERGRTIIALDYFSPALRRMEVELRIIRDPGDPAAEVKNVDSITEFYLPPKKYATGTFNFEHSFQEGKYIGLVNLHDGPHKYVSRFPFAVGVAPRSSGSRYAMIFLVLAAGGAVLIWGLRGQRSKVL